ncbi:AP-3 complex subunit delta-like [Juglans microcarpa x Juglans regia]|uniref:AP-3 complex subunit delta-like n=1 Tax=Juglans microcarpa x Juglans regia TaxID=2249226 RepID=UPI001B7DDA59|nr:AP-3 complex subunit delta-like [Juglans microcarpa x Juglans regia]
MAGGVFSSYYSSSSIMETLFQRTLEDLIKGLRLQLIGESAFVSKAIDEIRREVKSTDPHTKSTALQKLSYLASLHFHDMSWAAFHVVEVMSSSRFSHKRIGYHAASLSFHDDTPVLLLITNQLRKDLASTNEFEVSLALECLSRISTPDLARDLTPEIFTLLSTTKILVRKKAISVVLRVFAKYPDAVRVCFKRLVENLDSSDPQILAAVVGVFCELASQDPGSYLPLAPEFYRILIDSKNNWVLIKVLKIFAKLAPLEPRLAKRVVEPICDHLRRTGAKSLMFECIRTVVSSFSEYESAVKLAVVKIRELLVDDDPNLKYLGLQALSVIAPKHLWAVLENKEVVIKWLSDEDPNIKLESLRLVMAMVSESNVVEISRVLVNFSLKSDPGFCNEILGSILFTCSRNVYEMIIDFDWYVSLLGEMSRIPHCQKGDEIENQLIDIGLRVKDVRPELLRVARDLLIDPALLGNPFLHRILAAAAWVSGEYVEFSRNPFELMEALLQPRTSLLPLSVRAVYIHSAFKVLIFCLHSYILQSESITSSFPDNLVLGVSELVLKRNMLEGSDLTTCEAPSAHLSEGFNPRNQSYEDLSIENGGDRTINHGQTSTRAFSEKNIFTYESIINLINQVELALGPLTGSHDAEVLERTRHILCFIGLIKGEITECLVQKGKTLESEEMKASKIIKLMSDAFSEELGPVSVSAQQRVPIPEGLVLKENLDDLETICADIQVPPSNLFSLGSPYYGEEVGVSSFGLQNKEESEPSNEATSLLTEHRKLHGLYYLALEKNEIVGNDYPPANEPKLQDSPKNDTEDLVKLTVQSLATNKKPNHAKTRPVVVKLDEGDLVTITAKRPETKDDLVSGAVREVLLGSDTRTATSQSNPSDKSSSKRKGKEKLNVDHSELKENLGVSETPKQENPSSRKNKHRTNGKERGHKSPGKIGEEREENGQKGKQKSSHRHARHKARHRADAPLNVVSQTPVIPDFLL